mgnify:CR=1 FL=1
MMVMDDTIVVTEHDKEDHGFLMHHSTLDMTTIEQRCSRRSKHSTYSRTVVFPSAFHSSDAVRFWCQ